jgi:hypothetical protein
MTNRYILNPDGTITKYEDESFKLDETTDPTSNKPPAVDHAERINLSAKKKDVFDVDFGGISDDEETTSPIIGLLPVLGEDDAFGFKGDYVERAKTYLPFNSYEKQDNFADEFEILGGFKKVSESAGYPPVLVNQLFSYFAESILRLVTVEAVVLVNRLVLDESKGDQSRVNERYILRIGKYDYTEYDAFTRYVYNILNYPQGNSHFIERLTSYFIGFTEWLTPDNIIDLNEIIKDTTIYENELDFFNFASDSKALPFMGADALVGLAYSVISVAFNSLLHHTAQKRAKLLFRKFYQEKYWKDNILYRHKSKSTENWFEDLNYYYFKFYIERMHVGLKLMKKYVYDESYLQSRTKDSSFNRVSGQRSNRHLDYAIQILTSADGKAISGDIASLLLGDKYKPDKDELNKIKADNTKIDAANKLLPEGAQLSKAAATFEIAYDWQYKHSDGDFGDENKLTRRKKPGQSTRIRALPQLFTMHESLYKALIANGAKSISLGKDLTQNFFENKERRIPDYAVTEIENALEAEYMPFYLHDVRTNEILSFHAFIDSITDSFNPEYNSSSGFGRIDDVRTYVKTTRNINLSFTLAATSESDHDLMWYQINKIVAMAYPQWSDGYSVEGGEFKYPFTQVPTASPLVRLRVGDVIKSNYSRTNLSRLHGVGERIVDNKNKFLKEHSNKVYELMPGLYRQNANTAFGLGVNKAGPKTVKIDHPVACNVKESNQDFVVVEIDNPFYKKFNPADLLSNPTSLPKEKRIEVVVDVSKLIAKDSRDSLQKTQADIDKINKEIDDLNNLDIGNVDLRDKAPKLPHYTKETIPGGRKSTAHKLMKPVEVDSAGNVKSNNPITKSYESGMSRGLAGFMTQLDVNYNEVNWETSRIGSKAPMLVKITINFAPIHDIPPGLDHNGMLRAPTYNVGRINNQFFGDPKDHSYTGSGRDLAMQKYNILRSLNNLDYEE